MCVCGGQKWELVFWAELQQWTACREKRRVCSLREQWQPGGIAEPFLCFVPSSSVKYSEEESDKHPDRWKIHHKEEEEKPERGSAWVGPAFRPHRGICWPRGIIWYLWPHHVVLLLCHSSRGCPAHLSRDPVVTVPLPEIASTNGGEGRQRGGGSIGVISDAVAFLQAHLLLVSCGPWLPWAISDQIADSVSRSSLRFTFWL